MRNHFNLALVSQVDLKNNGDMPLKFACPICQIRLSVAQRKAGQMSSCPSCHQSIRIPEVPVAEEVAATAGEPLRSSASTPAMSSAEPSRDEPTAKQYDSPVAAASTLATNDPIADSAEVAVGTVALPRWVIYGQAALIAVVAATFFFFGMMVGQTSDFGRSTAPAQFECQITGQVQYQQSDRLRPDQGAVVFLVPTDTRLAARPELSKIRPEEFEPLENTAIDLIEAAGGRVVRINQQGRFDLSVLAPREYYVLIISKNSKRPASDRISKSVAAEIGQFFFPVEELIGDQNYLWTRIKLNRHSQHLDPVEFM